MQNVITRDNLVSKHYERKTGRDVWRENLRLAVFAADKIRSTLGPKGSYKLVAYNRGPERVVKVTKDAIAVLDELAIQYPPAIIVAESAKLQREEAGDGTATFVVLLSALLKKADELLSNKIHANTIIHGFSLATDQALKVIDQQAFAHADSHDVLDVVDCERGLLTPGLRSMITEAYEIACSGGNFEKENIRFLKKPGQSAKESVLIKGVVLKKEKIHPNMPDRMENLRVAIITEKPGINRLELKMKDEGATPIRLNIKEPGQMRDFKEAETKLKTKPLDRLVEFKVNVLLSEQLLDSCLKDKLASLGIFALETVDKKDTQAVAKATGAKAVGQLGDLSEEDVGVAEELLTDHVDLEKTVTIKGCAGATFLLRGAASQVIDELEAAVGNSMTVQRIMAKDSRVLPGGGASEACIAQNLKEYAKTFASREQVVICSFADALLEIPRCLAENYGLNATDVVLELKSHHAEGDFAYGVSESGCLKNVCREPARIKRSVIRRAYEVSSLMLRIDELLVSKEIAKFHKK